MLERIKKFFARENPYAELAVALEPYNGTNAVECCRLFFVSGNLPSKVMLLIATVDLSTMTTCPEEVIEKMLELCKEA